MWENKERIKRNTLIGKFEDGGVEMIDLDVLQTTHTSPLKGMNYFKAIKVTWIKRLMSSDSNWNVIGNHLINQFGRQNLILRITTSDINNLPVFYKQIFQACISTNKLEHCDIKSEYTLLRQPIWHNIHIQYKRKTLYFKKLIEKNIIFIKDLQFVNGILDETYIYSIMGNTNCWMEVFQLKNALLNYKEKLLNFSESTLSTRAPALFITNKYTKEIYNIHVASVFIKPEFKILKCRPELENIEVSKYINIAFQNKLKYMDDRKLAEFNYKIINNILTNKAYLSKWIGETNAMCSFW